MSQGKAGNTSRASSRLDLIDCLGALLLVLLSPLVIVAVVFHLIVGLLLHVAVWCCWCARGQIVLFVYSDSPVWHDHIEEHILPRLGRRTVVLNWSQRARWRWWSLAVRVFRYFGGDREFNPLAIVFRPFRLARSFRFYEPFREFKHGRPEAVERMETALFELLDGSLGN